jgi:hypothetical protein
MTGENSSKWSWIWVAIAALAIAAAVYLYLHPKTVTVTRTEFKAVPEIKTVVDVRKVYVPVKQVVTLDKREVAKTLDMPWLEGGDIGTAKAAEAAQGSASPAGEQAATPADPAPVEGNLADLQVTATADLPKAENGHQVVSILDTETGITTLIAKEKPAPWLEFDNALVAGIRYGVNHRLEQSGTVYGSWEFLRVKDFHMLGYGEINTNAEGKVQADLQYRR